MYPKRFGISFPYILILTLFVIITTSMAGCLPTSGQTPTPTSRSASKTHIHIPTLTLSLETLETTVPSTTSTIEPSRQVISVDVLERIGIAAEWELQEYPITAWSPSSTQIAIALEKAIFVVDTKTFEQNTFRESGFAGDFIHDVAYSTDGKVLAAISGTTIQLWESLDGELISEISDDDCSAGLRVAFSPDGQTIATSWWNISGPPLETDIYLWDTPSRQCRKTFLPLEGSLRSLKFSPDGSLLVIGLGATNNQVLIWDVVADQQLCSLEGQFTAFVENWTYLASWDANHAFLWDINTCQLLEETPELSNTFYITINPVNSLIAVGGAKDPGSTTSEFIIQMMNFESSGVIHEIEGEAGWISYLEFSPDGRFLLSVVSNYDQTGQKEYKLSLWGVES